MKHSRSGYCVLGDHMVKRYHRSYEEVTAMNQRWIMIIDSYEGLYKQAANILSGVVSGYLEYVLPAKMLGTVTEEMLQDSNLLVIGNAKNNWLLQSCETQGLLNIPEKPESYSIYVGESIRNPQGQMIAIAGFDAPGVLYGCMDFCNRYCGNMLFRDGYPFSKSFFDNPFGKKLPSWKITRSPAVKTRALWTWGHVIYDYRAFFDNMAKLRLNEIVIWNDRAPLNAQDVVSYAHSLGIKVIWGFAWGWDNHCSEHLNRLDFETLPQLKAHILQTYEEEYAATGADGIYFQSFTETSADRVGERCIAQVVTDFVNDVAGSLLEKYPQLHIQFGLHATSVNTHLEFIQNVDKRVHIVWEDCGAFPYHYYTAKTENFSDTLGFTEELLVLRGAEERFGAVLKGMLNLDWPSFEHFSEPYILGERTKHYLQNRQINKDRIWRTVQAGWLKNIEYVRRTIALIAAKGHDPILQALVEDAMFENEITLSVALYAEMLWTPEADSAELTEEVAKFPCVHFANP